MDSTCLIEEEARETPKPLAAIAIALGMVAASGLGLWLLFSMW